MFFQIRSPVCSLFWGIFKSFQNTHKNISMVKREPGKQLLAPFLFVLGWNVVTGQSQTTPQWFLCTCAGFLKIFHAIFNKSAWTLGQEPCSKPTSNARLSESFSFVYYSTTLTFRMGTISTITLIIIFLIFFLKFANSYLLLQQCRLQLCLWSVPLLTMSQALARLPGGANHLDEWCQQCHTRHHEQVFWLAGNYDISL